MKSARTDLKEQGMESRRSITQRCTGSEAAEGHVHSGNPEGGSGGDDKMWAGDGIRRAEKTGRPHACLSSYNPGPIPGLVFFPTLFLCSASLLKLRTSPPPAQLALATRFNLGPANAGGEGCQRKQLLKRQFGLCNFPLARFWISVSGRNIVPSRDHFTHSMLDFCIFILTKTNLGEANSFPWDGWQLKPGILSQIRFTGHTK